jgi:serine protease
MEASMRKLLAVAAIPFSFLTSCRTPESPRPPPAKVLPGRPGAVESLLEKRLQPRYVPGEVVVKMKAGETPGAPRVMAAADLGKLDLELARERTSGGEVVYRLVPSVLTGLSEAAAGDRMKAMLASLSARPDVEYAQPNYIFQITATPNDTGFPRQWHYLVNGSGAGQAPGGIGLPTAWDTTLGSSSVVVAVIDTGILADHEDIAGSPNLTAGYDMISDPAIAGDGGGRDPDPADPGDAIAANECFPGSPAQPSSWHGTHVSGTIGVGRTDNGIGVAGVNWHVKVQPVRVLGKCGGTMVDINDAIRWAAGLPVPGVPDNPTPARVINMSLGGGSPCSASPATQSAINDAVARGVTVVVAAGNEASDASGFLPASCAGVVTVAASDRRGSLATRYSNFGARVDLLAPGGDVAQDSDQDGNPDGVLSMVKDGYAYYNGTSMASPHVAGVAALLLAQDATRTPSQILGLLKASARPRTASQCPRPCGAGLLDAAAAVGPGQPTPVPGTVEVTVSTATVSVEVGKSTEVSATVRRGGMAEAGKTVTFGSSNALVATAAPGSVETDPGGVARVTIAGVAPGTATVQVESQGARASVAVTVPRKVPGLPLPIAAALLASGWGIQRWRARRRGAGHP